MILIMILIKYIYEDVKYIDFYYFFKLWVIVIIVEIGDRKIEFFKD